jgi:hypothetical protein
MSSEFISIIILGGLYVYQSYRHWKLEKLVFTQFAKIWNFQHDVIDAIDRLRVVKELEVEYLARLSNNES